MATDTQVPEFQLQSSYRPKIVLIVYSKNFTQLFNGIFLFGIF